MLQYLLVLLKISLFCIFNTPGKEITNKASNLETQTVMNTLSYEQIQDFRGPDDKSVSDAIKSIAYYLRNFKFNEWDRRLYQTQPKDSLIGFYKGFPVPPLKILHWEVYENCDHSFIKCIYYLQTVIDVISDACVKIKINSNMQIHIYETLIRNESKKCITNDLDDSFMPFYSPIEKFQWKTTASYYMCWYTMLGIPALSMLSEPCDNFGYDLDFGSLGHDPRSNNKMSFACALFSFCPDPCCPQKYIMSYAECSEDENNPCFIENTFNNLSTKCETKRHDNQNLNGIIANKWNVSCFCKEDGYIWSSKYGMCVDINECTEEINKCDVLLESCLNTPGSYYCVYKSGLSSPYTFEAI